ncbi:hypothetical protein BDN72DRAFT_958794 [Pluteus cervinus]|uniref:Uncharacterized protein n=1 Tax=Pluteus cervinus TaxID=181527 RepID=A0ACD3AXF5_9AGAR|nr:hypothetical protein BDN72DRAFT_958794 [Pluteus cervinus]
MASDHQSQHHRQHRHHQQPPLQPPVPFSDFEFSFDPSLSNIFPNPPPLPSSADLFSPSETIDLLGFLDNFNNFNGDVEYGEGNVEPNYVHNPLGPYANPHLNTSPDPSVNHSQRNHALSAPSRASIHAQMPLEEPKMDLDVRGASQARSIASESSSTTPPSFSSTLSPPPSSSGHASSTKSDHAGSTTPRIKPLLSTPQKRLNHIMSEQKRRNAIRDGYAQLIALLAPAGAPGLNMPTRGRPKGSGSRGKGQSKGKSGVLFRAVEYCRWLEEGRDALRREVMRVEGAAGINPEP